MLVDPRAPVHAISGIVPTQTLLIPPDLAAAALDTLNFSIMVAPTLRAAGGLALPLPSLPGYDAAFLEQRGAGSRLEWMTQPQITTSVTNALWSYSPQALTEGWVRFGPAVLTAALLDADGQPIAQGGTTQTMTMRLTNRSPVPLTFAPGEAVAESRRPAGSIFYLHLGRLVDESDWAALTFTAPGWTFTRYQDATYGSYVAATCAAAVTLTPWRRDDNASDASSIISVAIGRCKANDAISQAHVLVDYYAVKGVSDGVSGTVITIQQSKPQLRRKTVR